MKYFVLIILLISSVASAKKKPINLLIWWDYLDNAVIEDLKSQGYELNVDIYKSNEVAMSKLLSPNQKYDVAVLSETVSEALLAQKILEKNLSKKEPFKSRRYYPFLKKYTKNCIPYLWSSTIFASNIKDVQPITSFDDLGIIQGKGYQIGVIDDKFEFAGRLVADNSLKCKGPNRKQKSRNALSKLDNCDLNLAGFHALKLSPEIFISSIGDFMKKKGRAVYGWSGELAQVLDQPELKFFPARKNPIAGMDLVCVVSQNKKKTYVDKFIVRLTNQINTRRNVKLTQYFSPYKDDTKGLHPKYKELHKKMHSLIEKDKVLFLLTPDNALLGKINKWWRKVRYEK